MTPESPSNDEQQAPEPYDREPVGELVVQSFPWEYEAEELAPPVDEARLLRYCDGPMREEEANEVKYLITHFRSWSDAMNRFIDDRLSQTPSADP